MEQPLWMLLPEVPDWRWLLERTDTPLYPTARLFRQSQRGGCIGVIMHLLQELQALRSG
ncbi:MAG: hypothetical protein ACO271_01245 [Burkholderiales bacterium]